MLKKRAMLFGTIALLLSAGLLMTGCKKPPVISDDATLTAMTIGGVAVADLGTPGETWNDPAIVPGAVILPASVALTQVAVAVTPTSEAAESRIGRGIGAAQPTYVVTADNAATIATLASTNFVYVEVTAEDGETTRYYKVLVTADSDVTTITATLTIGGATATRGTPNSVAAPGNAADPAIVAGAVTLSTEAAAAAAVVATPTDPRATIKYAKASGTTAPVFGDTASFAFTHGDFLYIQVTSSSLAFVGTYKIEVAVDAVTTITAITVNEKAVTPLPTAAATPADATEAIVSFDLRPNGEWAVVTTPTTTSATVRYAKAAGTTIPTEFGTTSAFAFAWGDFLYIEVTAGNGVTKAYYKVQVIYPNQISIQFGTPTMDFAVDQAMWENAANEIFHLNKIYAGDSTTAFRANPDTSAQARVMWDLDGIWVYAEVTDPNVNPTAATGNYHTYDSLEVFIDEDRSTPTGNYTNDGGQYRVGANGEKSGDPSAATNALSKFVAWKVYENAETPEVATGYRIVMQAPFRWASRNPANGTILGFELQVNACSAGETRDGVLVWNNIAHTNYQNVASYGEAVLAGMPPVGQITTNLTSLVVGGEVVTLGAKGSTVAAAASVLAPVASGTNVVFTPIKGDTGQTVTYALTADPNALAADLTFETSGTIPEVATGEYVIIKVVSTNGAYTSYYKVRVAVGSSVATIDATNVKVHGVPVAVHPGSDTFALAAATGTVVLPYLTSAQLAAIPLNERISGFTATDPLSTVEVGISGSNAEPTQYYAPDSVEPLPVTSSSRITIRVTAENTISRKYYVYRVTTSNASAVTALAITAGGTAIATAPALGTPSTLWNGPGLVAGTITLTTAEAGAAIVMTPSANGTTPVITYAKVTGATEPVFGDTAPTALADADVVYIKVVSGTDPAIYTNVYKLNVTVTP